MIHASLIVIYTDRLDACRAFYTGLGLTFTKEQHGAGPEHHAATLGGTVFELYPAGSRRPATGSLRLGLTIPADSTGQVLAPGRHVLADPDGRVVDLLITQKRAVLPPSPDGQELWPITRRPRPSGWGLRRVLGCQQNDVHWPTGSHPRPSLRIRPPRQEHPA